MYSRILLITVLCTIVLSSCSFGTQVLAPTPVPPTATMLPTIPPTLTSMPTATNTSIPTNTPFPTQTPLPVKPSPTFTKLPTTNTPRPTSSPTGTQTIGTSVSSWSGLPIMPGAMEGKPAGFGYLYAVKVSISEAEAYYQKQMSAGGWKFTNRQSSETSLFGGPAVILDFTRSEKQANVMLIFSAKENYTMVMLTIVK